MRHLSLTGKGSRKAIIWGALVALGAIAGKATFAAQRRRTMLKERSMQGQPLQPSSGIEAEPVREAAEKKPESAAMQARPTEKHEEVIGVRAPRKGQGKRSGSSESRGAGKTSDGKTIYTGAKGGRYYFNQSGHKVYIEHS